MEKVLHEIPPIYNKNSQILILGSFPSVASREVQFFYGHPQNRFWKVIAAITKSTVPSTIAEKTEMLQKHNLAVWDVIAGCTIEGSADSSIRDVVPNDIRSILEQAPIQKIICNGATSYRLYQRYCEPITQMSAVKLPSTSPANAAFGLERLVLEWEKEIHDGLI